MTTGLRRGDIEAIRIGDIHFDRNTITTQSRKAGKAMAERPIPENDVYTDVDPVLRQAISLLPVTDWL